MDRVRELLKTGRHRPRRLYRVRVPDQRPARLVRGSLAQGPQSLYEFEPSQQQWAAQMAALLIEARDAAAAARAAGQSALGATVLDDLVTRYRALAASGPAITAGTSSCPRR